MKNVVKCYKHFFGYFNALKTHGGTLFVEVINAVNLNRKDMIKKDVTPWVFRALK